MNDVLKIFMSMSISGSLLILIFLAFKHFLKDRLSRQWQYYIWILVIARMMLPFAPETNLMTTVFQKIDLVAVQVNNVQSFQHEPAGFHKVSSLRLQSRVKKRTSVDLNWLLAVSQ